MPAKPFAKPGRPVHVLSSSPSAGARVLALPHVLEAVVNKETSRNTLVACLRVNKRLHEHAGKIIYHSVNLSARTWVDGIMLGVSNELPSAAGNFKQALFAHTRILSIGHHNIRLCGKYARVIEQCFPNVEILRILDPFGIPKNLPLCGYEFDGLRCPFYAGLKPRKVVYRNYDGGRVDTDFTYPWSMRSVEHVVCILPTGRPFMAFYETPPKRNYSGTFGILTAKFPAASRFDIVFQPGWEDDGFEFLPKPLNVEEILCPLQAIIHSSYSAHTPRSLARPQPDANVRRLFTIYGLEKVQFKQGSTLQQWYEASIGLGPVDHVTFQTFIYGEIGKPRCQTTFLAEAGDRVDMSRSVSFRTLENYLERIQHSRPPHEREYSLLHSGELNQE